MLDVSEGSAKRKNNALHLPWEDVPSPTFNKLVLWINAAKCLYCLFEYASVQLLQDYGAFRNLDILCVFYLYTLVLVLEPERKLRVPSLSLLRKWLPLVDPLSNYTYSPSCLRTGVLLEVVTDVNSYSSTENLFSQRFISPTQTHWNLMPSQYSIRQNQSWAVPIKGKDN